MIQMIFIWLVISTHLKNISQLGSFAQVGMNINTVIFEITTQYTVSVSRKIQEYFVNGNGALCPIFFHKITLR